MQSRIRSGLKNIRETQRACAQHMGKHASGFLFPFHWSIVISSAFSEVCMYAVGLLYLARTRFVEMISMMSSIFEQHLRTQCQFECQVDPKEHLCSICVYASAKWLRQPPSPDLSGVLAWWCSKNHKKCLVLRTTMYVCIYVCMYVCRLFGGGGVWEGNVSRIYVCMVVCIHVLYTY